jgi:hypothetical protein
MPLGSLASKSKFIIWLPIIGISLLFVVLYIPEFLGFSFWLTYPERMNLILTVAIAMFAAIEGYSTYMQVVLQDKKNMIDDARNELEKAYGPINSLLNKIVEKDENFIKLNVSEKLKLDEIMSTYPFMFSQEINDYWQKNIRNLETKEGVKVDKNMFLRGSGPFEAAHFYDEYQIPLEFVTIFNSEYKTKVQSYNDLLRKLA